MVLALFARIGALYRNKARSEGLVIFNSDDDEERGKYSENFKLWCVKLKDLTENDFKRGTLEMEKRAEAFYQEEKEMWPPSYAEFRALCKPSNANDCAAHKDFKPLALPDKASEEKARAAGACELDRLMSMFKEPEPTLLTAAEIEDAARAERIR